MLALGCRREHTAEHDLITLLGSPALLALQQKPRPPEAQADAAPALSFQG